jgi:hypothetical protein
VELLVFMEVAIAVNLHINVLGDNPFLAPSLCVLCVKLFRQGYDEVTIKVKVKLSLCFNWASLHEGVLGEWRYSSTHSLTSERDGGEWSASRPGRFTPRERAPGTHWIGGWVGPRAVLDAVVKRNIPSPSRESNLRTPIVQPIVQRYTDWAITAGSYQNEYKYVYIYIYITEEPQSYLCANQKIKC